MSKNGGSMPDGVKSVMGWALGIGIVALILLVMLILFGNLSGNVGFKQDSTTFVNQTMVLTNDTTGGNATDVTGKVNPTLSNLVVVNKSGYSIPAVNYSVVGGNIYPSGASTFNGTQINVSGTFSYDTKGKIDTDNLIGNYTRSNVNVATQLPTTGTILGVALLLTILIGILIFAIRKLTGVSTSTGGSSGMGSGSSKFKGSNQGFG